MITATITKISMKIKDDNNSHKCLTLYRHKIDFTTYVSFLLSPQSTYMNRYTHKHEHTWWKCKLVQPLWKTVWQFLKKLKLESPYDPAIPLLGVRPKKWNQVFKEILHSHVRCHVIHNNQDTETTLTSVYR